jgi:hypothetical protein
MAYHTEYMRHDTFHTSVRNFLTSKMIAAAYKNTPKGSFLHYKIGNQYSDDILTYVSLLMMMALLKSLIIVPGSKGFGTSDNHPGLFI